MKLVDPKRIGACARSLMIVDAALGHDRAPEVAEEVHERLVAIRDEINAILAEMES